MTPQQIEAMKQALEELYPIAHNTTDDPRGQAYKAITAIKEALAQPEQIQPSADSNTHQPERHELQAKGEHPAPCARHCEANAFQIVIKNLKAQLAQPEQEPVAWLLTDKNINSLQVDSIQRLIDRLKHAHHTDIHVRINGHDEWFEADWLKHMVRVTPPQPEQNPMSDEMLQAITDPENQPSQYGTVTLDYHFEKIKKWEDLFERLSNKVLQQLEQEPVIDKSAAIRIATSLGWTPQRTWVGLTEQDLDYLCNLAYTGDEEFALAVQAKLMEKNA